MSSRRQNDLEEASSEPSKSKHELSLNDRFFRYFQHEITALQEQMNRLAETSTAGGESRDAIDHCLAGISRLSSEVQDASSYVPPYDQRIYAEAIKALQEKLAETRAAIAPRQKFSFKTARKNPSAVSLADMAELDAQGRRHIPGYQSRKNSSVESSLNPSPVASRTPANAPEGSVQLTNSLSGGSAPLLPQTVAPETENGQSAATSGSSSEMLPISVDSQSDVRFTLPTSTPQATVSASITTVHRSVINTTAAQPFAALSIKDVTQSVLVCGEVNGAAHITAVKHSIIVVSCQQFRMHDCNEVDVYLGCSSTPIIENCHGVRFTRIPSRFLTGSSNSDTRNSWTHVDDFSWLKIEHSPNWRMMDEEEELISDDIWKGICTGGEEWSLERILQSARRLAPLETNTTD
ncbi:hypothetical protein PRK78_005442 [Emydomyces testavorans]|uniref:C-CAP/cofactor C-like domain-containing protein n=1 Tax=Emydomyces testavorans TaxID=2070801 RepID=A0AAF0DNF2_9EURO|nr:hypothetical protein PRK78_005442 [Emydomyces testavorans]